MILSYAKPAVTLRTTVYRCIFCRSHTYIFAFFNRKIGRSTMKRKIWTGGAILGIAAVLGIWSVLLENRATVNADTVSAPKFEVDPFWPKPLPNHWVIGQTIGVSVDSNDNVWIIHRPATLEPK